MGWGWCGGSRLQWGEPGHLQCRVLEGSCDDLRGGSCAWILVTWVTKLVTGSDLEDLVLASGYTRTGTLDYSSAYPVKDFSL